MSPGIFSANPWASARASFTIGNRDTHFQKHRNPMVAVDDFLKTVLRSRLLDRQQLREVLRAAPPERRADPEGFADHLVRSGKLSRFQARKLLKGTVLGLILGPFHVLAPIGQGGMGAVY